MHWPLPGTDAIITLRCREASSQMGSHLQQAPHPESNRLTARVQKMIMATGKIDEHRARGACDRNVCATHPLSYSRNGMSILVLLLYSGYAVGKVAARFRSSTIPQ